MQTTARRAMVALTPVGLVGVAPGCQFVVARWSGANWTLWGWLVSRRGASSSVARAKSEVTHGGKRWLSRCDSRVCPATIRGRRLLDWGVQDSGHDGAAWLLSTRGVDIERSEPLLLAWTIRGAPHLGNRFDEPMIRTAVVASQLPH